MKVSELSEKQLAFLVAPPARINGLVGSVRSGKSFVTFLKWLDIVAHAPKGANLMIIAKNERSLRRNILDLIAEIVGPKNFRTNYGLGECYIYGRKVYITGANDARAEGKLRGITLYAALCDEITLFDEDFTNMLLSRLSDKGAMLIFSTNPDGPHHYIKTKFIDRQKELNMKVYTFTMEDNLTLDPEYVESLKREYVPGSVFYRRFILGEWSAATGAIFPFFTDEPNDGFVISNLPPRFTKYVISCDFGQTHPTAMLLLGLADKKWYVIKEHYVSAKTVPQFSKEFGQHILSACDPELIESADCDPGGGGLSLLEQLRVDYPELADRGVINHAIKKHVAAEIEKLSSALFNHELLLYRPGCKRLIGEIQGYVWNEKATLLGKDEPVKANDDGVDALRYAWNRIKRLY